MVTSVVPGSTPEAVIVSAVVGGSLVLLLLVLVVVIGAVFVRCMQGRKDEDETARLTDCESCIVNCMVTATMIV